MNDNQEYIEGGALAILNHSEIDQQVSTALRNPRKLGKVISDCKQLVSEESTGKSCIYGLERTNADGKKSLIDGPSVRFAEILAYNWGNLRVQSRIIGDDGKFITAQGICHDLEKNVAISKEVKRRITTKTGRRFSDDMVAVTGNAAASIALRNAVTTCIPQAIWGPIYDVAKEASVDRSTPLLVRRQRAFNYFLDFGIHPEQICKYFAVSDIDGIREEQLIALHGIANRIKDGTPPDEIFGTGEKEQKSIDDAAKSEDVGEALKQKYDTTIGPRGDYSGVTEAINAEQGKSETIEVSTHGGGYDSVSARPEPEDNLGKGIADDINDDLAPKAQKARTRTVPMKKWLVKLKDGNEVVVSAKTTRGVVSAVGDSGFDTDLIQDYALLNDDMHSGGDNDGGYPLPDEIARDVESGVRNATWRVKFKDGSETVVSAETRSGALSAITDAGFDPDMVFDYYQIGATESENQFANWSKGRESEQSRD